MKEVFTNFSTIFESFILFMAFFWTFAYLNTILQFVVLAYNKEDSRIYIRSIFIPSMFWTIYIILFCK